MSTPETPLKDPPEGQDAAPRPAATPEPAPESSPETPPRAAPGARAALGAAWRRLNAALPPATPGWRAAHAAAVFLTLAAIAHLLTVMLIAALASDDAVAAFGYAGEDGSALVLRPGADGRMPVRDADPSTAIAVCGYDLSEGPFRVSLRTGTLPLSLSLHATGGIVAYAVTDRAAVRDILEFVIVTQAQLDERIASEQDDAVERELRVLSPSERGVVAARAVAPLPSDRPRAETLVGALACGYAE